MVTVHEAVLRSRPSEWKEKVSALDGYSSFKRSASPGRKAQLRPGLLWWWESPAKLAQHSFPPPPPSQRFCLSGWLVNKWCRWYWHFSSGNDGKGLRPRVTRVKGQRVFLCSQRVELSTQLGSSATRAARDHLQMNGHDGDPIFYL